MGPKTSPKSILEGSGGLLGANLETRCFQDIIFDDFGSILGPPLGPVWGHFEQHKGYMYQNQDMKIIDFATIYYTLATFEGAEHGIFLLFFWSPLLGWLLEPILLILAHFWGPFWRPF